MWTCYIVACSDKTYYTGITNNLKARLDAHNQGKGAKYTCARRPVVLIYKEQFRMKSRALRREIAIKKLTRREKEHLIKSPK